MQEKSFFLVKNQQVVSWKNGKGRGLTGNVRVIVWNYEENGPGSGDFFETPVQVRPCSCKHSSFAFVLRHDSVGVSILGIASNVKYLESNVRDRFYRMHR